MNNFQRDWIRMRKLRHSRIGLVLVVALVAAFAVAPSAVAQNSIDDPSSAQYDPPIPDNGTASSGGSGGSGEGGGLNATIGSLPFTGMDLLLITGVGFVLVATGFGLRRLSNPG
jgi:hypothetical protein